MTDRCQNFPRLRKRQRETEREIESSVSAIRQGLFQHGQDTTNILELITDIVCTAIHRRSLADIVWITN